jgi:hypothetical protein
LWYESDKSEKQILRRLETTYAWLKILAPPGNKAVNGESKLPPMQNREITIETVIIGGGFSGLFLADSFIRSRYDSFLLVERHKNTMGGYAVQGGIKVGLLPAGERTKKILHLDSYELYENQFIQTYERHLIKPQKSNLGIDFENTPFTNKYYYSYILPKANAEKLIAELLRPVGRKILFGSVCGIITNANGSYSLYLDNNTKIQCKKIVVASGRNYPTMSLLKEIGQTFTDNHNLLFGCRVTFDSENAERLYRYQPDFKIKDDRLYQTYCFNYRGRINSYSYNNHKIYAGSFNEKSKTGNCFIGYKKVITSESILQKIGQPFKISYRRFKREQWPTLSRRDYTGIADFIENIMKIFDLRIKNLYFPALEQFWSKPTLRRQSLESDSLPNVYFVGDASGISFGFLQCYVTANFLKESIRGK